MARPRFDRLEPTRQRTILAAAETEFGAHGYAGASLNRIIEAAGLSKGVFYYYFDDKADLAATVFERAAREAAPNVAHLNFPEGEFDFWAYFDELVRGTIESLRKAPRQTDALSRLGTAIIRDPELSRRLMGEMRDLLRVIARFWRRGQELGAVRDDLSPELLVQLLQGVKEALARVLLPVDRAPTRRELERFIDMQVDLFRRVASPEGQRPSAKRQRIKPKRAAARPEVHS